MSGQPIIFDFTVSIGGMTAPIARVTLDGAGEQGSSLLSLQWPKTYLTSSEA